MSRYPSPLTLPARKANGTFLPGIPFTKPFTVATITFHEVVAAYEAETLYSRYLNSTLLDRISDLEMVPWMENEASNHLSTTQREDATAMDGETALSTLVVPAAEETQLYPKQATATLSDTVSPTTTAHSPILPSPDSDDIEMRSPNSPDIALLLGHKHTQLIRPYRERPVSLQQMVQRTGCVEIAPIGWTPRVSMVQLVLSIPIGPLCEMASSVPARHIHY